MDMQRKHGAWTCSIDMRREHGAWACKMDMQPCTRSMSMQCGPDEICSANDNLIIHVVPQIHKFFVNPLT
jgi:hypothetical protein